MDRIIASLCARLMHPARLLRSTIRACRRIAQQIAFVFGVEIDKDVVRGVLAKHCRPMHGSNGPS